MTDGFQPYSKAERLLNLTMALRGTRTGLDRDQIRAQVRGYRPDATPEAFERMFERDKDELRALGIPVTTLYDASGLATGYRIDQDWSLPALELDRAELAVLSLAARVWQRADLAPAAMTALRKVEASLGVRPLQPTSPRFAGMSADSPNLRTLIDACSARRRVAFAYRRAADRSGTRRHVEPWGVVWWRGHWYLVGWDTDRRDLRVFRASRIDGAVDGLGEAGAFDVPPGFDARAAIGQFARDSAVEVLVRVPAGRGAALRRSGRTIDGHRDGDGDLVAVPGPDHRTAVAGILAAATAVRIVGARAAIEEAIRQLDSVLDAHARPAAPAGRAVPASSGPAPALAQFSRLLALVPWLAANSGVSVADAAAHFGIGEEQLLRDLGSVITSGADDWTLFDIQYWENGGAIEVIDVLELDRPLMLTPDEAFALVVALHALAALPGTGDRAVLDRVIGKVRALLGESAPADGAISVRVDAPTEVRAPIEDALAAGRALHVWYLGALRDAVTERVVDPVALVVIDGHAYLRASCRTARGLRLFRLDRVVSAVVSEEPARPVPAGPETVEPMAVALAATGRTVVVDVPASSAVLERHPVSRTWELPGGWRRAELPVGEYAWARHLVLGGSGEIVLREPGWLVEQVQAAAGAMRAQLVKGLPGDITLE